MARWLTLFWSEFPWCYLFTVFNICPRRLWFPPHRNCQLPSFPDRKQGDTIHCSLWSKTRPFCAIAHARTKPTQKYFARVFQPPCFLWKTNYLSLYLKDRNKLWKSLSITATWKLRGLLNITIRRFGHKPSSMSRSF